MGLLKKFFSVWLFCVILTAMAGIYTFAASNVALNRPVVVSSTTSDEFIQWKWHYSFLATDRIDTFFPVGYGDDFRVSKLSDATLSQALTQRGDYRNGIEPFTAPETGVYTFTFTVTGKFYLHDVDERYTQNMPGMKPVIELRKFTINGTEMHGIDKQ